MTKTKYYDLQMDDPQDDYDVEVVNANLKKIDEQMKTRENATDALQEPEFTVAEKRENIASKEKMPKILGKIAKFFTDLKTVAFSGKYSDLDGKPAIVNNNTATEAGSALDARQANPTIEGTMANQISQLNSDLSDLSGSLKEIELTRYNIEGIDTSSVQCFVKNNIAYVNIGVYYRTKEAITGWTKIVSNLPIPAYTKNTFIHYSQNDDGDFIAGILLNSNGELMIEGGRLSYTKFICSLISYPIK